LLVRGIATSAMSGQQWRYYSYRIDIVVATDARRLAR